MRKGCVFCERAVKVIDYKDPTLRNFLTERGKILPAKVTGVCSKHQRALSKAIKRARNLALLPYVVK
jgi:small subunit ribosomal protein S18|uniref:Small ribosomal subunit protein bS18 n=1 Tax=candidate division WOR-3 bacterium TaxID=2052148 RepID=A0A7C3YZ97_UNCW3